jgi:hypothetical protein
MTSSPPPAPRARVTSQIEVIEPRKGGGFWDWIKAAF